MSSRRTAALVAGVFIVLTFIFQGFVVVAYGPLNSDPHYVTSGSADTRALLGGLMELLLIAANLGTAAALFPIIRRQNEGLALGYVTARIVECTLDLAGIVVLLAVGTLHRGAVGAGAGSAVTVSTSLIAIYNQTADLGAAVVGVGNGLILGYLMLRSGLVPRPMTVVGMVGGPLLGASAIAVLFGALASGSAAQAVMTLPEGVWEVFLALWLIVKGFNASARDGDESPVVRPGRGSPVDAGVAA